MRRTALVLGMMVASVATAGGLKDKAKKKPPPPVKKPDPTPPANPEPTPDKPPEAPASPAGGGGTGGGGAGTGGGSGSSAEAPAEPPKQEGGDVDALRQEYLTLRDELFKSRARANAVASQLYSTRITIKLTYTTARYYNPAKASVRLDGANVYEDATGAIAGDDGVRFDGYVAPGRHLITFRVEATGKDDDTFTSITENQIVVKAVANKDLIVSAKAKDGGDIAYEWKRKERGSYGLGIDVAVRTEAHTDAPKAAAGTKK